MAKETNKKGRNFSFTIHEVKGTIDSSTSDVLKILVDNKFCKTVMFTHEMGKTNNTPHIQGYLVTNTPNRFTNVIKKINEVFGLDTKVHVEAAREDIYTNLNYITKELKEHPDRKHMIFGDRPLPIGKKRDDCKFESYVELIKKGEITLEKIMEEDIAHFARHEKYYRTVILHLDKKAIKPPPFIAWFSGTTGTGKSYTAEKITKILDYDIYEAGCDNNFFFPYNQEECSIWDDYRSGPITFEKLLKITDHKGCTINVKGGTTFFKPRIQIFTSPDGILSARTKEMKEYASSNDYKFNQLVRRVLFTADITSNRPDKLATPKEIDKNADIIIESFLSTYKGFLIETGFEDYITLIPALKDVIPRKPNRLMEYSEECKLTVKTNQD